MKLLKKAEITLDVTRIIDENKLTGDELVDKWEAEAAKRSSLNLRTLLALEPMQNLLADQIKESDKRIREYWENSDGDFNYGQCIMKIKGIDSKTLLSSIRELFAGASGTPEQVKAHAIRNLFPVHPEHYTLKNGANVETMGGLATLTKPMPYAVDQAPAFVRQLVDNLYPLCMAGAGPLLDGTPFTYVLQQFKDTEDGMEANLIIWYPAGCPAIYVEEHVEHYAVEFRNGCLLALGKL